MSVAFYLLTCALCLVAGWQWSKGWHINHPSLDRISTRLPPWVEQMNRELADWRQWAFSLLHAPDKTDHEQRDWIEHELLYLTDENTCLKRDLERK